MRVTDEFYARCRYPEDGELFVCPGGCGFKWFRNGDGIVPPKCPYHHFPLVYDGQVFSKLYSATPLAMQCQLDKRRREREI